jgi:benzoate-CoA ligase
MPANAFIVLPDEFNAATYFIDRHIADGRGERIAIECGERKVAYQQLLEMVNRAGNCLRKLGVRVEERVVLLLFDTPEFAATFFGAIKIGAVPVPINTLLKKAIGLAPVTNTFRMTAATSGMPDVLMTF